MRFREILITPRYIASSKDLTQEVIDTAPSTADFVGLIAGGANAVARLYDITSCPHHGSGQIAGGNMAELEIGGLPVATIDSMIWCDEGEDKPPPNPCFVVTASATVFAGGRQIARVGDATKHLSGSRGHIITGDTSVFIGGGTVYQATRGIGWNEISDALANLANTGSDLVPLGRGLKLARAGARGFARRTGRAKSKTVGERKTTPKRAPETPAPSKIDPTKPAAEVLPGSLKKEFPGQHLDKSLNEIVDALRTATGAQKESLKKAKKMLQQSERLLGKTKNK